MPDKNFSENLVDSIRIETKTFELFVPVNLQPEKVKFFNKKNYNPQFAYPRFPRQRFQKVLDKLQNLQIPKATNLNEKIKNNRHKETILKLELFLSRGDPYKITTVSEKLYQLTFNKKYLRQAKKDSQIKTNYYPKEHLTSRQTAKAIKAYLNINYGIDGWSIELQKNADFYTQIRYKKNLITLNEELNWEFTTLDSMLAHEIDGHVVRAINANRQKEEILQNPLPFYIKTEEGLASYLGDYCAEGGETSLRHHAMKYLGGFLALNNSFREIYKFFTDNGFSPELAFQRTFRLKRGFTDTSAPGCFAREGIYYEGLMEVKKYIKSGGDIKKLFAAKTAIEDLSAVNYANEMLLPERLINNF